MLGMQNEYIVGPARKLLIKAGDTDIHINNYREWWGYSVAWSEYKPHEEDI